LRTFYCTFFHSYCCCCFVFFFLNCWCKFEQRNTSENLLDWRLDVGYK
jgi:hypothetical protein